MANNKENKPYFDFEREYKAMRRTVSNYLDGKSISRVALVDSFKVAAKAVVGVVALATVPSLIYDVGGRGEKFSTFVHNGHDQLLVPLAHSISGSPVAYATAALLGGTALFLYKGAKEASRREIIKSVMTSSSNVPHTARIQESSLDVDRIAREATRKKMSQHNGPR